MTIINPNSISGISSITALNSTAAINLFKADGTSANIIAGVTTGSNFITGTSNVHSTGYECTNINASGIVTAASLDISGGTVTIPTVAGTDTNAALNVLFQTAAGVIDGGSGLTYNPGGDVLTINGADISANTFRGSGALGTLTCDNHSSTTFVNVSNTIDISTVDNATDAFTLKQGSNEYITVDTNNSSELITFGNRTTGPDVLIEAGTTTFKHTHTNTYAANDTTQCGYQSQNLSNTTNTYSALRLTAGSSNPATAQLSSIRTGAGANDFTIQLESGNTAFEAIRITSEGKIGIGHHIATQITKELTIRPADGGGILIGRPGDTVAPINVALQITTRTSGSEAYHTEYHTSNCNALFSTYEGGGTGGNFIFQTGVGSGNDVERLRITSGGQVRLPVNGQELTWGASQQMKFYYENSEERMYLKGDGAYGFAIRVNSGNRIEINKTTGDVVMQGGSGRNFLWDNSEASLYLTDNGSGSASLKIGTGGDLRLYHDAGNNVNYITAATNGEIKFSANQFSFYDYSGVTERARIKSTGEFHISDRNSSNTGDHFFQAGAFGIRMEDTGGYNRWNIERNYGGFQSTPVVHLSAQGKVGINQSEPGGSGLDITTSRTTTYQESSDQRSLANLVLRQTSDSPNRFVGLSFVNGGGTQAEASINLMQTGNYEGDFRFKFRAGGGSTDWRTRFRMTSGGMMGFNGNPNRFLHVYGINGGGNFGTAAFEQNHPTNSSAVMFMSTLRDGNAGESFLQCNRDQDNNGQGVRAVFYIRTNGDVDSDTNSYGGISDIKLKENIVDANSQWDDIKNIKVRNFNFKDNPSQKMLGVVAQEVETVSAGLVKDCPDENITSPGPEGTSTKSVKYSILYMKAIKALQEAQTRIETLEAKVAALEG